jgi:hypothetical protein
VKTDDLIRTLAADSVQPANLGQTLILGMVPALLTGLAFLWTTLGFRFDLAVAMLTPVSAMRIVLAAGLGIAALRIAFLLARPEGRDSARLLPLAIFAVVAAGLWLWAYVTAPGKVGPMIVTGETMIYCVIYIPLMSVLPVASILFMLRRGATTAPALAGFAAGLAGSGFAAATYALHCTEDSPLFYVTWYGLAILAVTLVSTVLGPRLLRW